MSAENVTDSAAITIPALVAFAAAQGEMENPAFNRTVKTDKYRFDYADLAGILAYVRPILSRHGLLLTQPVTVKNGVVSVVTRVRHISGYIVEECELTGKDPGQPQQLGSLTTYLRRYGLLACLALAAEDDDDGGAAAQIPAQHAPRTPKPATPSRPETPPAHLARFLEWCGAEGIEPEDVDAWLAKEGKPSLGNMDATTMEKMKAALLTPDLANILKWLTRNA